MKLKGPLPQPLEIKSTRIEQRTFTPRKDKKEEEDGIQFSMTSVLNQRPTELMMEGLSNTKLNMRYTKRKAPSPPMANGHLMTNGFSNGDITPIAEDAEDFGLASRSRLNSRYVNGVANGGTPRQMEDDLSANSKLNARYVKSNIVMKERMRRHVGGDRRRHNHDRGLEGVSASSDNMSVDTGHSDWSHWVEDVFNNALNEHVETLSDARSVENRLKGGGKGVPGPGMQQIPQPPATLPILNLGLAGNNTVPTSPIGQPAGRQLTHTLLKGGYCSEYVMDCKFKIK